MNGIQAPSAAPPVVASNSVGVGDVEWNTQELQRALNKVGQWAQGDADIPPPWPTVTEDGVMNDPTKISIEVYRKARGLNSNAGLRAVRAALAADIHAAAFSEEYSRYAVGVLWYPDWLKAAMKRALRIFFKNQGSTDAQADALMSQIESEQKWPWLKPAPAHPVGTVNGARAGVGQDPLLDLVNTRDYRVGYNDSPASIARRFGLAMSSLIAANPQKPTTVVAGTRTFRDLRIGEVLNIPSVGLNGTGVGFNFLKATFVPWGLPQEIAKAAQHRHVDHPSREGRNDWEHWRRVHPGTPRSDYDNWWNQYGQNGGTISGVGDAGVGQGPADAVAALTANDPCDPANVGLVWAAQQAVGVQPDGKWGSGSAKAANAKGFPSPPGCSPRPSWWAPAGQVNQPPVGSGQYTQPQNTMYGNAPAPAPAVSTTTSPGSSPSTASPAVQQLTLVDPCDPSNVSAVGAAQSALGMQPDGKYGSGTATAARKQLGSFAPSACSPRPSWWLPPGQSNLGGAAPASAPTPMQLPAHGPDSAPITGPGGPGGGGGPGGPGGSTSVVVQPGGGGTYPLPAPKKPGISTGAIIAGAIGVAGLVGIVALAVSGGKKTTTRYRTRKGKTKYITRKPPKKHHKKKPHKKGKKRR